MPLDDRPNRSGRSAVASSRPRSPFSASRSEKRRVPSVPRPRTATGTGSAGMRSDAHRGRMVRQDRDHAVETVQERPEHPVHVLDRPDLLLDRAQVPGLVGGLDMAVDEVEPVERGERGPRLALVVRVEIPGRAGHSITSRPAYRAIPFSRSTAEIMPPATPNRSAKSGRAGRRPARPGPDPGRGGFPAAMRARLTGCPAKTSSAAAMHASRRSRSGPAGDRARLARPRCRAAACPVPPAPPGTTRRLRYEIPGHDPDGRDGRLERGEERGPLGARDVAGREVGHDPVEDRDQVAAVRHVVVAEGDAHARGLERTASRVVSCGVVPEQPEVRDVRAGFEAVGHGRDEPRPPLAGDPVHVRGLGELERSEPAESWDGLVGHPVAEEDDGLHGAPKLGPGSRSPCSRASRAAGATRGP